MTQNESYMKSKVVNLRNQLKRLGLCNPIFRDVCKVSTFPSQPNIADPIITGSYNLIFILHFLFASPLINEFRPM